MVKKIVATLVVLMVSVTTFLITAAYVQYNLITHSVYYAQHVPHSDNTDPVLMNLVDNIRFVYHPEINGIGYDFDGKPAILFYDKNGEQTGFITAIAYGYYCNNDDSRYRFDHHFELTSIFDETTSTNVNMNTISKDEVVNNLYIKLQPLIDRQTEPDINLQWIFNIVYKDKFD